MLVDSLVHLPLMSYVIGLHSIKAMVYFLGQDNFELKLITLLDIGDSFNFN